MTDQEEAARPLLRSPAADEARKSVMAAAERLSAAFGVPVAACTDDWVHVRGQWRMSWAWLVGDPAVNHNFRVSVTSRWFEIGAWAKGRHSLYAELDGLPEEAINEVLDRTFGTRLSEGE